jgi:hypothetical protein
MRTRHYGPELYPRRIVEGFPYRDRPWRWVSAAARPVRAVSTHAARLARCGDGKGAGALGRPARNGPLASGAARRGEARRGEARRSVLPIAPEQPPARYEPSSPPCASTSRRSTTANATTPPSGCSPRSPTNNYDSRRVKAARRLRSITRTTTITRQTGATQPGAGPDPGRRKGVVLPGGI